jgi:hypothetical protein
MEVKPMGMRHVFDKENDSEKLALDIVEFLRKWGMWIDIQIFTGGKCYLDDNGELKIRNENHPEKYLRGQSGNDCNGDTTWEDFSNPERLLDMTFEGPLSLLLRHHEYEVRIHDVSDEVKHIIVPEACEMSDEDFEIMCEYLNGKKGWDPAEYDSYEEWLELNQFCDMDEFNVNYRAEATSKIDFSSREEYEDFLMRTASERQARILEHFDDEICESTYSAKFDEETFFDNGEIADMILEEFNKLLEKYGLWYELGFAWSLTTYRI